MKKYFEHHKNISGLSKEDTQARQLIEILGRTAPTITAAEKVARIIMWRDDAEEIINETLKILYMRDVKLTRKHNAIDFINHIKKPALKKSPDEKVVFTFNDRFGIYESLLKRFSEVLEHRKNKASYESMAITFGVSTPTIRKFCYLSNVDKKIKEALK